MNSSLTRIWTLTLACALAGLATLPSPQPALAGAGVEASRIAVVKRALARQLVPRPSRLRTRCKPRRGGRAMRCRWRGLRAGVACSGRGTLVLHRGRWALRSRDASCRPSRGAPAPPAPDAPVKQPAPATPSVPWHSKLFGFNDTSVRKGQLTAGESAELTARAGATASRFGVDWRWSEPVRGKVRLDDYDRIYQALVSRGIRPIMTPTYAPSWALDPKAPCDQWKTDCRMPPAREHEKDYGAFAALLAQRYPLAAIEIWNEPNAKHFWQPAPDPERYARLVKAAYSAVKAVSPSTPVVAGAMSDSTSWQRGIPVDPFLRAMYAAGAGGHMDALSFHPYPHASGLLDRTFAQVRAARKDAGEQHIPLWITESGWTTSGLKSGWPLSWIQTEEGQAQRLVTLYQRLMSEPDVQVVLFHTLVEPPGNPLTDPGHGYGVVHADQSPKPAYCALGRLRVGHNIC